jgi:hypothetical protein
MLRVLLALAVLAGAFALDARSHAERVSNTRKYGKPAENPSAIITSAGRSV